MVLSMDSSNVKWTTICLRNIDVKRFWIIDKYDVTHFGGAPIVLNMITGAPERDRKN